MQVGLVGLGKMGANIACRLLGGGHEVTGFDHDPAAADAVAARGVSTVGTLDELVDSLARPRLVWVVVPAGEATAATLEAVGALLDPGDTVVDGGNTMYKESMDHAAALREQEIDLLDVGTSGGIWVSRTATA